ncbi:MAG: hypothetical protein JJU33_10060 [Phycisphaerales bacterium]|nr:hypothetical protein [Phycisphaerales bacterium]
MYTLCLDLHLRFVPPMYEHAPGIVLTRTFELPFPPYSGLAIYRQDMEEYPSPDGLRLAGVVWDMDRGVFLAHTITIHQDEPLAFIPDIIRGWMSCGWTLGSCRDAYPDAFDDPGNDDDATAADDDDYERLEILHTLPKTKRDRDFNQFFKSLIREMSESYNNLEAAYAMDKLGRLLVEEDPGPGKPLSEAGRLWQDTCREFDHLDPDAKTAWQNKVAKYPSLEKVLHANHGKQSR